VGDVVKRSFVTAAVAIVALGAVLGVPDRARAQVTDSIPGVTLGLLYESSYLPALAIQPFTGRLGGEADAPRVEAIVGRDLRYSDRFNVMDSLPADLVPNEIDYQLWDQLGAVWLVSGRLEGAGDRYVLLLEVHDVVFQEVRHRGRFPVPNPEDPHFRMSVHLAADAVVNWIFGEPGIAATRIAFERKDPANNNSDLYVIDSDGENLTRITRNGTGGTRLWSSKSPAWSADGQRIVYSRYMEEEGRWRLYELDMESGTQRAIPISQDGDHWTPEFSPDGNRIVFSVGGGGRAGLYSYNLQRDCCLQYISGGNWEDMNPTFSPDGDEIAFMSNRLGVTNPQVYVMPATGGTADLVSPYEFGPSAGYYTSPEWAPLGEYVAFHGRVTRRGFHQILVSEVDAGGRRLRQLTQEGENEDPSWAPDGRHIAFVGRRNWGTGLMIVDAASGTIRMLLRGQDVKTPSWSPPMGPTLPETLRSGG